MDLWICGSIELWIYGSMDLWICGLVDLYGFVDLSICMDLFVCMDLYVSGSVWIWIFMDLPICMDLYGSVYLFSGQIQWTDGSVYLSMDLSICPVDRSTAQILVDLSNPGTVDPASTPLFQHCVPS